MAFNLLFSGDFVPLADTFKIGENCFRDIMSIIAAADAHVSNLECPLTLSETKIGKIGPHLKARPDTIKLLKDARVDVACMANNHIFDYGETGLQETINICEQNGMATLGIVNRPDAKKSWLIKEIKGKKIGFLNYCEHEFSVREEGEFGANGYDPTRCFHEISALRPQLDYLIVIYHGGNEYYPLPRPGLKKAFHYLADLGADAVIGHHTHVISGYEIYKGKPLVYGLGNFYFPYENEPEEWHTGVLCSLAFDDAVRMELIPIEQCRSGLKVRLLAEQDASIIKKRIGYLSEIITDDSVLLGAWKTWVKERATSALKQAWGAGLLERILLKIGFPLNKIYSQNKRLAALNRWRCQSHQELVISSFKELEK